MKFDCRYRCAGIVVGHGDRLASGSGAAIENARAAANERSNQLRSFVLDDGLAGEERAGFRSVCALHAARGGEQGSGSEFDAFRAEFILGGGIAETDGGCRDRLIVVTDVTSGCESVLARPTFHQP